jgi:hypothetical protein
VRDVGTWLRETMPDAPVGVYRLERWHTALRYYAGQRIHPLESDEDVKAFLEKSGTIVLRRREFLAMRDRGVNARVRMALPAVWGTEGGAIRRQVWGEVYVVTGDD